MPDLESNTPEQATELAIACACGAVDVLKTGFIVETTSVTYQAYDRVGALLVKSYRKKKRSVSIRHEVHAVPRRRGCAGAVHHRE